MPEVHRATVTRLYQIWLLLVLTLIINFVACLFILLAGSSDGGKDLGGSITFVPPHPTAQHVAYTYTIFSYMPIITVTSFLLWYRQVLVTSQAEAVSYFCCLGRSTMVT